MAYQHEMSFQFSDTSTFGFDDTLIWGRYDSRDLYSSYRLSPVISPVTGAAGPDIVNIQDIHSLLDNNPWSDIDATTMANSHAIDEILPLYTNYRVREGIMYDAETNLRFIEFSLLADRKECTGLADLYEAIQIYNALAALEH